MLRKVLAGLAIVSTAAAQMEITPYVNIGGGYARLNDSDISVLGTKVAKTSFDNGFSIEGAAGLKLDQGCGIFPVRIEMALSFQRNDFDEFTDILGLFGPAGQSYPEDGTVDMTAVMANGYLDMPIGTLVTPYIMAGIGGVGVDFDGEGDTAVAGQIGAGVGYAISKHVTLDLKYKYLLTDDLELVDQTTLRLSSHQVLCGIRYQF